MKKIVKLLSAFLLSLCIFTFFANPVISAEEDEEEYTELEYYYNDNKTKVKIPAKYETKDAEMRGAWVATVFNMDFKKQNGTSEAAIQGYKDQFHAVLDTLESYNINTIFFQVRPTNDAFYKSEINPWSQFLVGAGVDPGWDPLEWMVEETHKRGMEFQCWMNAFRVTQSSILGTGETAKRYSYTELVGRKKSAIATLADGNYAKLHPEAVVMGSEDCKLILNPGDLGVQQHIVDTLKEIVENYDVDGLHFDDYFYLSGGSHSETENTNFAGGETYNKDLTGENTLNDLPTYEDYKKNPEKYDMRAGLSLGNFRRESINNLMKNIRAMIDEHNAKYGKHVEYGSKPAAVWQSSTEVCPDGADNASPEGSLNTCHAYASNWALFADTKKWVEEGWVDWIAPQVYYDFENREVPYADIVTWWADVVDKVNLKREAAGLKPIKMYVAHGIYLYDGSDVRYNKAQEITWQLKFNQMFDCIKGSALYDYTTLANQKRGNTKTGMLLLQSLWKHPVFSLPRGENNIGDAKVSNTKLVESKDGTIRVSFDKVQNAKGYALYKVEKGASLSFDVENKVDVFYEQYGNGGNAIFEIKEYDANYDYYLRAVSTHNHLSTSATKVTSEKTPNSAPKAVDVVFNEGKDAKLYAKVKAFIPYSSDDELDKLTYTIKVSVTGQDGRYYNVDKIDYAEDGINVEWEAYLEGDDCVIKVEITDGDTTTVCYSNSIKIAEEGKEDPDLPKHEHTACSECGKCTSKDCDGTAADKCAGHDPVEPSDPNPSDKDSGCKKDVSMVIISLISLSSLLVLIRKRK